MGCIFHVCCFDDGFTFLTTDEAGGGGNDGMEGRIPQKSYYGGMAAVFLFT